MRVLVLLLILAGPAAADPLAERRVRCTAWMIEGYPSGIAETSCRARFGLPSPFLFLCARANVNGFESDVQRQACGDVFARAAAEAQRG